MDYLKENQAINESTLTFSYTAGEQVTGNGIIPIRARIAADEYKKIDKDDLVELVRGKAVGEFRHLAEENPFLAKVQFSLWPAWIARIPEDPKRVDIDVHLNSW